jgi:hypothetical protein
MEDAFKLAEKNGIKREEVVRVNLKDNTVTVKLSAKGGYSYSFFKDLDVTTYPDIPSENNYVIKINGYKSNE